jgi:hypothetical protein
MNEYVEIKKEDLQKMNIMALSPIKGDKEIADELRKRFFTALSPVCELIGEAEKAGFEVGFGFGVDAFGNKTINHIHLMRKY